MENSYEREEEIRGNFEGEGERVSKNMRTREEVTESTDQDKIQERESVTEFGLRRIEEEVESERKVGVRGRERE